jgi:outer membrane autotransporter protein
MTYISKKNTPPKRLAIAVAVAGTFLGGYGARHAYAGTCSPVIAGASSCSGAAGADTTQTLSGGTGALSVTTTAGFGISTAAGDAIILGNAATGTNINFTDTNTSSITGNSSGIFAINSGTGTTSVTSTGAVTGTNTAGIVAANSTGSGSITVNAAVVTGGAFGIYTGNNGTAATSITSTGAVTSSNGTGINARNNNTSATNLSINTNTGAVTGRDSGIFAINSGTGTTSVTSTGTVTGTNTVGIVAANSTGSGSITVNAAAVTGGNFGGIYTVNNGKAGTSITSTGSVTGTGTTTTANGIFARNNATATNLSINSAAVTGNNRGIDARNYGTGTTSITSTGPVTGTTDIGIRARNAGSTLTLSTAAVTGTTGIVTLNFGSGATSVTSTGLVTGTASEGIFAYNNSSATNLSVNSAAVTGNSRGIDARNYGTGTTSITSTGLVTGTTGIGIFAYNDSSATNLTVNSAAVTGATRGIEAVNNGTGTTNITSTGTVTGTSTVGIFAYNNSSATNLTVNSAAVTGAARGIEAVNNGTGTTTITSTGPVTGTSAVGILVINSASSGITTINANGTVTGGIDGIAVQRTGGTAARNINVSNAVTGGTGRGISTSNSGTGTTTVTVNSGGIVSATSGNAIAMSGGSINTVNVNNGGLIRGSVNLGATTNTLNLNGTGTLAVQTGSVLAVNGNVANNGMISLQNNIVGAPATISGNLTGGGKLLVDVNLATDSADRLNIAGNVTGPATTISVNNITTGIATGNDIILANVTGTTTAGNFTLAAPVLGGIFNYNTVALNGKNWLLRSAGVGGGKAYTTSATNFEALGQNLLSIVRLPSLVDRTFGRIGLTDTGANSGDTADISTPIWIRYAGGYRKIDSNSSTTSANLGTKNWLVQAGVDFIVSENANNNVVLGVNTGYNQADTSVKSAAGKGKLDTKGYNLGLTATWQSAQGLYLDTQLQGSMYNTDLSATGLGGGVVKGVEGKGHSASIEVGKKYNINDSISIVPQVQVLYANVDADTFTGLNSEVVELTESKSLRARLGTVINKLFKSGTRGFIVANAVHEFEDETQVNVSGFELNNTVDRWTGELGVGVSHVWSKGSTSYELSGQVTAGSSLNNFGDSQEAQGQLAFKTKF